MKSLHATYPPLNIQASQTLLLQRFGSFLWTTFINWFWLFGNGCAMNEHFGSTVLMLPCRYSNLCFCVAYYSVGGKCLRIWWLPTRVYTVWPMVFLQCQVVVFSSELQGTLQLCRSLYCQHSGVHSISFFWKVVWGFCSQSHIFRVLFCFLCLGPLFSVLSFLLWNSL